MSNLAFLNLKKIYICKYLRKSNFASFKEYIGRDCGGGLDHFDANQATLL